MRYYRITFSKFNTPNAMCWNFSYDWYEMIYIAQNAAKAREHGIKVAAEAGIRYCCTFNLTKAEGMARINEIATIRKMA